MRWLRFAVVLGLLAAVFVTVILRYKMNVRDRAITSIILGVLLLAVSSFYRRSREKLRDRL